MKRNKDDFGLVNKFCANVFYSKPHASLSLFPSDGWLFQGNNAIILKYRAFVLNV